MPPNKWVVIKGTARQSRIIKMTRKNKDRYRLEYYHNQYINTMVTARTDIKLRSDEYSFVYAMHM